ncbi:hypothetical protein D3H35_27165 [Cohnella faecalis]|uniref:Arsenical efflux pump membrane protein ArsB n=2 Tax=Cohnella faecalis TaxID=2315694 RepID=A0A398CIH6_9BACL|nr:hypothetical protein D3H35_27165 [Cohnella faecalis]
MAFPGLTAAAATVIVCAAAFAKTVKNDEASQANENDSAAEFPEPGSRISHVMLFRLSWIILALILLGYAFSETLGIPVSVIACAGAAVLWIAAAFFKAANSRELLLRTPWLIVAFALAMNLIVYSLYVHGATDWFGELLEPVAHAGTAASVFGSGLLFSLLAACMNNLPAVLVASLSIEHVQGSDMLPFASLLGMSVGAKLTPIGSLATLLWLGLLRSGGIRMTWGHYLRLGLPLTAAVLLLSLAALWLQTVLFQ